jgi:ribosomal protein S18 acetylase RimI-like enzyme
MASDPETTLRPWRIRSGTLGDVPFLQAMLLAAVNWSPDRSQRTLQEVLADPHARRYVYEWGRAGDLAVVAETFDSRPAGAAWCRLFPREEPGYGFLDPTIPELSMGVVPEHRGHGIGRALLSALVEAARAQGVLAFSLSVETQNHHAIALYERSGFVPVAEGSGAKTMRCDLSAPPLT